MKSTGSLVNGRELVNGGRESIAILNPASGSETGRLWLAAKEDIDEAAEHAHRGFASWSAKTAHERSQILKAVAQAMRRDAEQMATLLTHEQGKTIREARGEVAGSADLIEWLAEESTRVYGRIVSARAKGVQQMVLLEPVGPVAAFSAWNYPLSLAARKVGHALAAGCSIVLKPAEEAPSAVLHLARLCIECGVPADAIAVVFGVPAMISERLIASPRIRKISFTGSVAVGRQLASMAGQHLKKVTFELGGHSPVIVMDDADLQRTVELSVASKFRNAGQICIAPTRFFVHDAIHDAFVDAFSQRAGALRVGDGALESTDMGPLVRDRRVSAMQALVEDALEEGALLIAGTKKQIDSAGFFWTPTVLSNVPAHARIMNEEPFGPIAPFIRFDDLEAVLEVANDVPYGLAGYAFTRSLRSARLIQDRLKVGMLGTNTYSVSAPEMPFAGTKDSGLGVAQGVEGLLEHMAIKSSYRADF